MYVYSTAYNVYKEANDFYFNNFIEGKIFVHLWQVFSTKTDNRSHIGRYFVVYVVWVWGIYLYVA